MKQLSLPLQFENAITLQGSFNGSAADLSQLACLMQTRLHDACVEYPEMLWNEKFHDAPAGLPCIFRGKTLSFVYDQTHKSFELYVNDPSCIQRHLYGVFIWQVSLICSCMAAIMRGKKVQLMHCSMLEKNGQALLLLGESGIGKSTSVKRWQQYGGTAIADDMVLLEYGSDDIWVHRLPTWSACRISLEDRCYPFEPPLKLKSVLAISRDDEREQIKELSKAEFFAQLYRCGFFHYLALAEKLPLENKRLLASAVKGFTETLSGNFKPQGFFANLNGNIMDTLGDYL